MKRDPSFPELFELIGFFEAEPVLTDQSEEWYYNHLAFTTVRGRDRIECEMEPSNFLIKLRWYQDEKEMLDLILETMTSLTIETQGGLEVMRVRFSSEEGLLIVELKPLIHFSLHLKDTHK